MQETYRIGNAQSIGSRRIQSNYFAAKIRKENECLAVLTDGTIDHPNGRRCAVLAVEACMQEFMYLPQEVTVAAFFDHVTARILRDMRELLYFGKTPYLSAYSLSVTAPISSSSFSFLSSSMELSRSPEVGAGF